MCRIFRLEKMGKKDRVKPVKIRDRLKPVLLGEPGIGEG